MRTHSGKRYTGRREVEPTEIKKIEKKTEDVEMKEPAPEQLKGGNLAQLAESLRNIELKAKRKNKRKYIF